MNVTEAVTSRRSVRAFQDKPVDPASLHRVLETAQRSPSGGNTQPWHAVMLTGAPLAALFAKVAQVLPQGRAAMGSEYNVYPPELDGAYEARRRGIGEAMYAALDIPRDNKMGPPQWSDIGMWLQTVMLLLREEGLDSCAQEAWAVYSKQIRECVDIPEDHTFFCGMAIGWGDRTHAVNQFPVARADLEEVVRWEGF